MAMPTMPGLDDMLEGPDNESLEPSPDAEAPEGELDAMFAADVAEAFPDLEDSQLLALQRAFLGLLGGGMG